MSVSLFIVQPHSYVFSTNHGSIDFGVFTPRDQGTTSDTGRFQPEGCDVTKMDVVEPMKTSECSRVPEDGFIFFTRPGMCM